MANKKERKTNNDFKKGNKFSEKYSEEFIDTLIETFEEWIYGTTPTLTPDGMVDKPNLFYFEFTRYFRETFGTSVPNILNSIRSNKPEHYEKFQEVKKILAEKLIQESMKGNLKEVSTKFYLGARFKWSEKIETKNENINTSIVWNEKKTYDTENEDDN